MINFFKCHSTLLYQKNSMVKVACQNIHQCVYSYKDRNKTVVRGNNINYALPIWPGLAKWPNNRVVNRRNVPENKR